MIGKNRVSLIQHLRNKIAKNYLNSVSKKYIDRYDQLATLSFDYISRNIALNGVYELNELNLLKENFGDYLKDKTVLDIGANIGNHTVFFANISESVYSFEPNEIIFQLLKFNVRNYKNVNIYNYGCSNRDSQFVANLKKNNWGNGEISTNQNITDTSHESDIIKLKFNVKRLDNVLNLESKKIGLIKIDVEGHELNALNGMKKLIEKNKPIIVFEQNRGIHNGTSDEIEFLKSIGYKKIFVMETNEDWLTPKIFPNPIKNILRLMEIIFLGYPEKKLKLKNSERLDKLSYRMIVMVF